MDMQQIALSISVGNFVLTWGLAFYMHLVNKGKVTEDRITRLEQDLDAKLDGQSERLARLEQDARHAPSHDDLKRIHSRIDDVNERIGTLQGEFSGANRTLNLIHEYLLNKKD